MTSSPPPPPPPEQQPPYYQHPQQPQPFLPPSSSGPIMPGWAWVLVVVFGGVVPIAAGIIAFVVGWNTGY
ncbi:hypothetical protein [Aeromicrobium sp. Leaf350]|uniref:hypothetical protein n=1 Tax=Aeromicrobium sp. Leaf350 TaxID=2876565 RepID=UPI001E6536BF|nr:hypothetical protein [Aeromicrobium sp. Leaf350]